MTGRNLVPKVEARQKETRAKGRRKVEQLQRDVLLRRKYDHPVPLWLRPPVIQVMMLEVALVSQRS